MCSTRCKLLHFVLITALCAFLSACGNDAVPRFVLSIETNSGDTTYTYVVNDTSLQIAGIAEGYTFSWSQSATTIPADDADTLRKISMLKPKSYDCNEQHALPVSRISFTNDSGTVEVDPNVNHPKEIDYAVRLLNRYVPYYLQLKFEDMQPAIEPDGKLRI